MSTLKIESLDNLLQLWEDVNLSAAIAHRLFELRLKIDGTARPLFMTGSEINDKLALVRPIPNYTNFRKELEKGVTDIDYVKYLPRVPKELRNKFTNSEEFSYCREWVDPTIACPVSISKWVYSKKVVSISKNVKVIPKSVKDGNYLNQLPYDQFILSLSNPLSIFEAKKGKFLIKEMIVFKDGGFVFVYPFAPNYLEGSLSKETRERWAKLLFLKSNSDFHKAALKEGFRELDQMRSIQSFWISIFSSDGDIYWLDKNGSLDVSDNNPHKKASQCIMEAINFVAYSIANASPEEEFYEEITLDSPISEEEKKEGSPSLENDAEIQPLSWNEILSGNVQYLKIRNVNGVKKLVKTSGVEKSPHVRRGHYHKYHTKDGVVKKWLNPITVREDKLKTTSLKGGNLAIKE